MSAAHSPLGSRAVIFAALLPCAIGLVTAVDYFDNALFAFFASYIAGGVHASPDELVWASSAYALGAVLGILQQPAWVERLGYRRYLAICMFAFAAGGVAAALCEGSMQLSLARAVQGYFIGPMLGACRILIQNGIPPARRAKALKTFMVMIVLGSALAPIAGAFLVTHLDWRWLFACTAPAAALIGLLVLLTLPDVGDVAQEDRTEPHRVAYFVFALAQTALQVVLTRSHFEQFTASPTLIGLTMLGVAGLALFGWQQWRHPAPLVRLHALWHPAFRVGLVLYVAYYYLSTGFSYLLPRLMEGGLGFTVGNAGYLTGAASLATGLLVFVYLRYSARLARKKWLIVAGFGIGTLAAWWLAQLTPQAGREALLAPLLLRGMLLLLIVLPVANITFRPFAAQEFAHSYRLKNLVRQLAISFATSSVIVLQQHRLALHETRLSEATHAENFSFVNALEQLSHGFQAAGRSAGEAHLLALNTLWRALEQQATFLASLDGFTTLAAIALAAGVFAAWQRAID